eukprot:gene10882-13331_t
MENNSSPLPEQPSITIDIKDKKDDETLSHSIEFDVISINDDDMSINESVISEKVENEKEEDQLSSEYTPSYGNIYSYNYNSGKLEWSLNQGKALYTTSQSSSSALTPTSGKRTSFNENGDEEININDNNGGGGGRSLIIPNIDGTGEFYHLTSEGSIEKLSFTIYDIIASSPFLSKEKISTTTATASSRDIENTLYIGNKYTSIVIVNSKTGEILKSMSHEGVWEEGCPTGYNVPDGALLFTRSDYKVLALDPKSGSEKWNLSIGEVIPYSSDPSLGESLIFEGSIELVPTITNRYKLYVHHQKKTLTPSRGGSFWESVFPSPPVSIYVHSQHGNILKKVDFVRRPTGGGGHFNQLIPYPSTHSELMVPPNFEPTFIFDQYDGQFYITSTTGSSNNAIVIRDGSRRGGRDNNNNNSERLITEGSIEKLDNNRTIKYQDQDNGFFILIESNQGKLLLLTLIIGILLKSIIKRVSFFKSNTTTSNSNSNNNNNNNKNNLKKTPKKKKKSQQQQQHQQQQKDQSEEEEDNVVEPPTTFKDSLLDTKEIISNGNQLLKQLESEEIIDNNLNNNNNAKKKIILENGNILIGKLEITQKVLGTGSCGTVVYEGYMDGRKVAIKRMLAQFIRFADREVSLLLHSDEHINVVRYYAKEEDGEFIYLALSFCKSSLDYLVTSKTQPTSAGFTAPPPNQQHHHHPTSKITITDSVTNKIIITPQVKLMILDLLTGLSHLHSLNIVHRDIKPQNILIDPNNRVKISDMGLGKMLDRDDVSLTVDSDSHGWQAAEYLNGTNRNTKKVDIFSIGCVIYYLITGSNPFGVRYNREKNVLKGKFDIDAIQHLPELHQLIFSMIQHDPEKRPDIQECLGHPFFWSPHKVISFLVSSSDYLEFEKPTSPLNIEMDSHIEEVVGVSGDWWSKFDQVLIDNIGRYRKYNGKSIRDLLRVIRNKFNHYRDLSVEEQNCLGPLSEGFLGYFTTKFPKLVIITYLFIQKNLRNEPYFKQFFEDK